MKPSAAWRAAFRLAALALTLAAPVSAQTVLVSPTAYNINPLSSNTAQVRFENRTTLPVKFRVEVLRWSTENGQYIYTPTRDVVANPAEFTIAPQATQVIRVGVLKRVGDDELTYRVFVRQVAGGDVTQVPSSTTDAQININKLISISLPVYVAPPSSAPKLSAQAKVGAAGSLELQLSNTGNRHLTLRQLRLQVGSQKVDLGNAAVLGHSVLNLPVPGLNPGASSVEMLYNDVKGDEQRETLSVAR